MENDHTTTNNLDEADLRTLRETLREKYRDNTRVLGCQLGASLRSRVPNLDFKIRFGGLRRFLETYFSNEVRWTGRQGLDDVYITLFSDSPSDHDRSTVGWTSADSEPSTWLWPAVSNPSVDYQLSWSTLEQRLYHAPPGTDPEEGLVLIAKLTKPDYSKIATDFVRTRNDLDANAYLQAIESSESLSKFIEMIRQQGRLAEWEVFRIDHVLRLFTERLEAAGATKESATEWADRLRRSQWLIRNSRATQSAPPAARTILGRQPATRCRCPDARAVAAKALEHLSDVEIGRLSLPLEAVMSALRSLMGTD